MSDNSSVTVLVVDDHAVFREGVAAQINAEPDMTVIGEAGNAENAIDIVIKKKPQIVLLDIDMPGLSPFDAAMTMVTHQPDTRIIFLSAFSHDSYIEQAIQTKAWGYITKNESYDVIRRAIREVAGGWVYYSDRIRTRIINAPEGPRLAAESSTRASLLTPREVEVLRYLARSMSTKEIAKVMHISPKTVDNHKTSMMSKLDIHDRVELARYAFREGIATP